MHAPSDRQASKTSAAPGPVHVLGPFAVTARAAGLWWLSDRLDGIGPLDRATFGWFVVIPVWFAAPIAAGLLWRSLDRHATAIAAAALAALEGVAAAGGFWASVAFPACEAAPVRSPLEWILPSVLVGLVVGGGLAVGGVACATLMRAGRRRSAIIAAAWIQAAVVALILVLLAVLLFTGGCQRPGTP